MFDARCSFLVTQNNHATIGRWHIQVPLIGLHEAESESKTGVETKVPLRDRHGVPCGEATLRVRFRRRANSTHSTKSLKEIDVLGGFSMVFDSPPPRAVRWNARTDDVPCIPPSAAVVGEENGFADGGDRTGSSDGSSDGSRSDSDSVSVDDEKLAEESVLHQMLHAQSSTSADPGSGAGLVSILAPGQRPDVGAYPAAFAVPGAAHRTRLSAAEEARYNSAMMIHPSVWGYQLTPLTSHDASQCHPVFFNYYLKLGDDAELDRLGPEAQRDAHAVVQFKAKAGMPAGDCPVCFTTDVPGCPCCWQFSDPTPIMRRVLAAGGAAKRAHVKIGGEETIDPRKAVAIDFDDPDVTGDELATYLTDAQRRQVRAEQLRSMHTKLKTRGAVLEYRQLRCDYIKIYVKGLLPMSPACWFTVEKSDTVGYLYNQYRANAGPVAMATRLVQLLLPTETGIFLLDNTDIPEDDMYSGWTTTDRKLSEYSIFTDATSIALLMVPAVNYKTPEVIDRFFKFNVTCSKGRPDCRVRGELADIPSVWSAARNCVPPKLPGDDEVQASIVDLLLKEANLYKEAEEADKAERAAALDAKMRARYGQRKQESLAAVLRHREAKEAQRLERLRVRPQSPTACCCVPSRLTAAPLRSCSAWRQLLKLQL